MAEVNTWTLADQRCRAHAPYLVDPTRIREFARAVRDFHPAHWSVTAAADLGYRGLLAPVPFACAILGDVQRELLDTIRADYPAARILHADQVIDTVRPLVAGDRLTGDLAVESTRQFADYDVLTIRSVLTDQHGAVVQTGSTALLARTGPAGARLAETIRAIGTGDPRPPRPSTVEHRGPLPRPPVPVRHSTARALTVGEELAPHRIRLCFDDVLHYAAIVGHHGPDSPDAATATGTMKLGLAAAFLSTRLGDPAVITRLRAQFAHFTHALRIAPGATRELEFRGRVAALDARRHRATIALDARCDGRPVFGYAAAEVALPRRDRVLTRPISLARRTTR